MSNAVAKVSFLQGQAWAKAPDGSLRALTVGSTLNDDEVLVTAQGARIELDVGNGEPLVVNGGLEVGMSRDFASDTATTSDEALLSDASVQEALTVLEQGGDLLEELEETAAGDNGGGGANDGHSFVQLTRVIEQTDSQAFNYERSSIGTAAPIENDAGYTNQAPEVTDQVIASNEDETVSGQIIANDIEGDQITFTLTTPPTNGTLVLDPATGQFTFTPNANYNGPDSFVVTVTDSRGNSSITNITLNIAPVNDAPTTNDINLTTDEDTPVNGQVVAQDVEGDTLTYLVSGQPGNGTVTLDPATGTFVYTPNPNYNGGDSFVVTISDSNGGTTTSTITIGVNPVNDAPVSSNQNLVTDEDVAIGGQVVASDVDGDTLGYSVSGQPTNGTVTLDPATGTFVYTPNANYNGSDSFVVTISDGNGGTTTSLINIGINPVNDEPVSSNQNLTTPEDTALTGQVVATDIEGDILAYSVSGQPTNGSVTLNPATGGFVYTPNANYNGSDSFVVTISDGNGGTTTSLINIGVTPVNDAPVSNNLNLTTPEETPVSGQINATDVDGDSLSFSVSGNPANGSVIINAATGSFTYTPNTNYSGPDSFVVTVSDGNGGTTTSVVSIGVTPVNDAPVASNLSLSTNENTPVPGSISASDPDGDTLSFSVSGAPANGTVVLNTATGTFTYTPSTGYSGSDSFVVTISDGKGGTVTSTVTIGVNSVNHAPTAANDNATTDESTAVVVAVRGNDTDPDGDSLTVTGVTQGANGSVVIDAVTGNPIYTPNAGFTGTDTFTYSISDGKGGTDTGTVTVTVNAVVPVNNAPVTVADVITVAEGGVATILDGGATNLLTNDSDADGDPLTAVLVTGPVNGTLTLNSNGTFSYTHNGSETTTDSFTYRANDGTVNGNIVTVTINVTPVNDAPIANNDTASVNEDGSVVVAVRANDTDAEGSALTVNSVTQGTNGSVVIDAVTGNPVYTPNAGFSGTDSFTYTVRDSSGAVSNTATVTITVTAVNHAPVAVADTFTVAEGGTLSGLATSVLANDTDADGDSLTAILVTGPAHGTLTLNADGTFIYVHDGSETTADSFTYKVNDGTVDGNTVTVNIGVNPVNDPAQIGGNLTGSVKEDTPAQTTASGNLTIVDPDAGEQSFQTQTNTPGTYGSFSITAGGAWTYNIDNSNSVVQALKANEVKTETFTVTSVDGTTETITITVNGTNDGPVAVADAANVNQDAVLTLTPAQLLGNDTDVDGDTLSLASVQGAVNGTVSIVGGNAVFTPTTGYHGPASFTYTVSDGNGGTATATVNVTVTAAPNVAPETNAVAVAGNEDTLITITLSGSDSDGTVAGYVIKSLPANGVLYSDALMTTQVSAGDLVTGPVYFKPNANWNGSASFDYAARDNLGLEDSTPATASITVNPDPDVAIIGGTTSGGVKEDTPAQASASGTLTIVDPDAGEQAFQAQTNVARTYGTFSISAGGNWTYNIDNSKPVVQALKEGETKTENITVTSIDGTTATVVITITGTNDGPVAVADTANVNQDAVLTLTSAQLLANDTDIDGDTLSLASVQGAVNGTVSIVGGNAVFTPTAGYHGPASFTYTVSDGQGGTATATVNVTVVKANTPPDAVDDSGVGGASNLGLVSGYFGYQEGTHGLNLTTVEQIYSFINGRSADATFIAKSFDYSTSTFTNNLGAGTNLQTFLGADAASLSADPATTTDAIIHMRGFVELAAGTYNFKVLADDGFQIRIDGRVVAEENRIQEATTSVHNPFTLTLGGLHSIEIIYWDQGGAAKFKVELSDNAGVTYDLLSSKNLVQHTAFSVIEDTPASIPVATLLANDTDADGDTLTITSVQGAVNGTVSLVGGNIIFTPAANYAGPASFTYTISDGKGGTDTAKVSLSVAPVNDAPVAVNDSLTLTPDRATSIPVSTLLANDTDIEGDDLTVVSVQNATHGTVSLANGNVTFTPTTGYEGTASFTYTIRDNQGLTSTATVNLMVAGAIAPSVVVNKAIVINAQGNAGATVDFPIITRLVDTDGSESLSVRVSGVPSSLTFNAGTNLGGGVWSFAQSDLAHLQLSIPSNTSLNQYGIVLTIAVTATESTNNSTATTSSTVRLFADYTTNSIATTEHGNATGTAADDFIQGGAGNNTIDGGAGNDLIYGGAGNDVIHGGLGEDVIYGGDGNDTIYGGAGSDRISGGAGNDTLYGGSIGDTAADTTADVFVWKLGDQGTAGTPAVDTIHYFGTGAATANTSGDILDLRDLLQGESVGPANAAGNLADYLHFEVSGGNTIIHISHTGGFSGDAHAVGGGYSSGVETQQIVLSGVNLQSLYSGVTTDQQIITQLLNNNKLITD